MLEEANYPVLNADYPSEIDILPGTPGTVPNRLPLQYGGSDYQINDIYPPPGIPVDSHNDPLLLPDTPENLSDSPLNEDTETDILTGSSLRTSSSIVSTEDFFDSGYFIVGESGEIEIDYVYDGGGYAPEVAIFSLEGINQETLNNYEEFITEAARRGLSNSPFGYVIISDRKEGASIQGGNNRGQYQGIKTFNMNPGEKFGIMLVPHGTIEEVSNGGELPREKQPLFSLATDNPEDNFWSGAIAEFQEESGLLTVEDWWINRRNTEADYNDLIFHLSGATGTVPSLDEVINPEQDWRENNLGETLNEYLNLSELTFNEGKFAVDESGEIKINYLFDGGSYRGELAIFSLEGLKAQNRTDLISQAAERALSNSELGYVVINDISEGALFGKELGEGNRNRGEYLGEKSFSMNPGEEFGFIFVPNGTVEEVFEEPNIVGSKSPLFSLSTDTEIETFLPPGQFVDVTGEGKVFAFEDVLVKPGSKDGDYNDFIFSVGGAEGSAASLDEYIDPEKDWRSSDNGVEFLEVVDELVNDVGSEPTITVELANDTGEDDTDKVTSDPTLTGTVVDDGDIESFEVSFNGESDSFVDVTTELESDGSFVLDRELLEEILGESLPEGVNTILLRATDEDGLESEVVEFEFTLEVEEEEDVLGPEVESMAGIYGLDAYPDAISLPPRGTRSLSVKIDGWLDSPELTADIEDISYVVEDGNLLEVSPEGVITALAGGETNVTVQYGEAEITIPVLVEPPETGPALVDESGGIVEGSDGSMVMLAPGALTEESQVNLTPLQKQDLSLPVPEGFEFAAAFDLEIEDDKLDLPAQLAIPAPADVEAGTEVWFLRKGALPDETGTWKDIWLQEESGIVDADGFIRTQSPPYPGILRPGEYMVVYSDGTGSATLVMGELTFNYNSPLAYVGIADPFLGIGQLLAPNLFATLPAFTIFRDISTVDVVAIPQEGLPVVTEVGVERAADGWATFETALNMFAPETDSTQEPVLQEAQLKFNDENGDPFAINDNEPVLFLTADNALINEEDLATQTGSRFEDLSAKFYVGREVMEGTAIPELSRELDENRVEVAFKIPKTVTLGNSRIAISRQQERLVAQRGTALLYEDVEYESNKLRLENDTEYVFTTMVFADDVAVIDASDPEAVVNSSSSADLLKAKIPVGGDGSDRPENLAVTGDNSRVYVSLRTSGGVAVIDPMVLSQVDNLPDTEDVIDPIPLPEGARPFDIAIDKRDRYAYIAEERNPFIYVLDIDPSSSSYHQVVDTIVLETDNGNEDLNRLAISSDDRRLFATSEDGYIYAVNIDPQDKEASDRLWRKQIGRFETETGAFGISPTTEADVMTFTNGNQGTDGDGFGVLEITNDDPESFEASDRYMDLTLGSHLDIFDVNQGYAVTLTEDASYGFVAGRNRNFSSDPRRGGNIGIIKDPLGDNPELVAATRPINGAFTHDLVLSNDEKYLYVSNPNVFDAANRGEVYIFDVEEMIETLEDPPEDVDFTVTPIDEINPDISIAASSGERSPVFLGFIPYGMAVSSEDWLDLTGPIGETQEQLPEFEWEFEEESVDEIEEISLFVSAFEEGEGLRPWDEFVDFSDDGKNPFLREQGLSKGEQIDLLSEPWEISKYGKGYDDYNPNRILTVTWKKEGTGGTWYWADGTEIYTTDDTPTSLYLGEPELGEERILTVGQTYYWGVEAYKEEESVDGEDDDNEIDQRWESNSFKLQPTVPEVDSNTFSSASIVTHGFKPPLVERPGVPEAFYELAGNIIDTQNGGLIMRYDRDTGYWVPVDELGRILPDFPASENPAEGNYKEALQEYLLDGDDELKDEFRAKPLVLLSDWSRDNESAIPDSGFSEAAADSIFSSLVQLDQWLGGSVGTPGPTRRLYDVNGNLIRNQGALFNSPLHFIGFSRGTIVNSEMIQRLGTFFPNTGGTDASNRDLQMTTLDPHDFNQPSLDAISVKLPFSDNPIGLKYSDFFEPKVQAWKGITFADNYYQTIPDLESGTFTPVGRDVPELPNNEYPTPWPRQGWRSRNPNPDAPLLGKPDVSVRLGTNKDNDSANYPSSRAGFTKETDPVTIGGIEVFKGQGGVHGRVISWYSGTSNLGSEEFGEGEQKDIAFRRKGDPTRKELFDKEFYDLENEPRINPWYRPNHQGVSEGSEIEQLPTEGIGTGWFYSVLGGGKDLRPEAEVERVPLDFDNTDTARMRGDYPVPTLFNGNFDAVTDPHDAVRNVVSKEIPGWSFHGGGTLESKPATDNLVDLRDVPTLEEHLRNIGNDPNSEDYQTNYAFRLGNGEMITHNRFLMPDWGALRFDLHAPEIDRDSDGVLSVSIKGNDPGANWEDLEAIELALADDPDSGNRPNTIGYYDYENGTYVDPYSYRIAYGIEGLETFHLDVPDKFRGESVTLRFEVKDTEHPIYLDDVFFKGVHARLGNPSNARDNLDPENEDDPQRNNYLIEKPQYTLSYSDENKGPNWVSWQLNQSWLGALRRGDIEPDTPPEGYNDLFPPSFDDNFPDYPNDVRPVDGTFSPVRRGSFPWSLDDELPENWVKTQGVDYLRNNQIDLRSLDRGHMVPVSYRTRTYKDGFSTYLTTNMLPQLSIVNRTGGAWFNLERETRLAVQDNSNLEFNIIAGGVGYDRTRQGPSGDDIRYPEGHPFENHPNPVPGVVQNFVAMQQNEETGEWEYVRDSNGRIVIDSRRGIDNEWIANPKQIEVPDYTWKVFVPLRPGQGVADITQNTPVTAVIFPNADPRGFPRVTTGETESYRIPLPNGTELIVDTNSVGDWTQYAISVRELENITGYDFFSEVPQDIQDIIEPETNRELFLA